MAAPIPTATPEHPVTRPALTRDFTVAVFVVHRDRVLLHFHQKLQRWLPPGGHIEPNELPDEAALREVMEETGVACRLTGGTRMTYDDPSLRCSWFRQPVSSSNRSRRIISISTSSTSPTAHPPHRASRSAGSASASWRPWA